VNAETAEKNGASRSDMEMRAALISSYRLSPSAIDRINESMRDSGLSFTDSALRLELVTQDDVDAAAELLRRAGPEEKAGLVEVALHKLSSQRQLVVRKGDKVKPGPQLVLARDSYNPRSETIRSLRTELLLRNTTGRAHIVCVVSPSAREGRSQLSAELAVAFAQLGRRTLLVDADMRKPQQHVLFPAGNELGLGDSLTRGENPYLYRVEGLPQMALLTAGTIPSNPLELISSGRFERLLSDWRNNNEFVVIDTPPVTSYADALAIATLAGRVLMVTRAVHTSYTDTREMLRRLATTRAEILGAVISYF
jgi:capsular exopolysaccharide synthesis family protein